MNVRRVRNFLILFLSVGLTSSAFALDTTALKDNCKPIGNSGWGQQTGSELYGKDQFNTVIGNEAKFFTKYKASHMVQTTYKNQASGTETVIQCFNFSSKRYATYAWVELVPANVEYTKFLDNRLFLHTNKKVAATARGEVLIRATTSESDPYVAQKAANQTWMKYGAVVSDEKLNSQKEITKLIKGKILGVNKVRVVSGPGKWPFRIFLHKVPVASFRITRGDQVLHLMDWKSVNERGVYQPKNTPNFDENRRPRTFVKKNSNRFRYYKVGQDWGIVGRYKGYILTINGPGTPKSLKKQLESLRIAYFFSVPKDKQK